MHKKIYEAGMELTIASVGIYRKTMQKRCAGILEMQCFTDTWLQEHIPDSNFYVTGFQILGTYRDCRKSGKKKRKGGCSVWKQLVVPYCEGAFL